MSGRRTAASRERLRSVAVLTLLSLSACGREPARPGPEDPTGGVGVPLPADTRLEPGHDRSPRTLLRTEGSPRGVEVRWGEERPVEVLLCRDRSPFEVLQRSRPDAGEDYVLLGLPGSAGIGGRERTNLLVVAVYADGTRWAALQGLLGF